MRNYYLKKCLSLVVLMFASAMVFAQTASITGKVLDETNQPLPAATIFVQGTQKSTATDVNGNFKLTGLTNGKITLEIRFLGYTNGIQVVNLNGTATVTVTLKPNSTSLNEVVVIGYGTAQKKDLTGSVAVVTAKDFNTGAVTTPEQLIQGKVAGVSIISNGGAPGAGSTIRIRGGASINGTSDPLFVIDGVPLSNDGIAGAANPLSLINPNDIESFSILKDASAAAIYGNRGSNGVIIITTKKGKSGKPKIDFSTQFSISNLTKEAPILSADQFRTYITANDTTAAKQFVKLLGNASTDWQKQIYQTSYSTDNNLSVSGTAGKLPYRVSVGYTKQNGILITSALQRYSSNINLSPSLFTDHLKINFNFIGSQVQQRFANQGAIGAANSFNPTLPVYSGNNNYGGFYEILDPASTTGGLKALAPLNPLGLLQEETNKSTAYRAITSLALDYKFHFFPDLHAIVNVSYDGSNGQGNDFIPAYAGSQFNGAKDANGIVQQGNKTNYKTVVGNRTLEGDLSYSHDFKEIHSKVTALAGYSEQDFSSTVTNYQSYFANGVAKIGSPNFPLVTTAHDLSSIYARLTYAYDDKYLLSGSMRSDVSTRFAPGIRTGNFPAGSAAWVISQESFLKDNKLLSNLKLRVGYGVTGNEGGIGVDEYLANYYLSNSGAQYQLGSTFYQSYRPGAFYFGRTWEKSATTNAAIDYGFLNDRITGSLDFYYQKTSNLLATIPQPAGSNFSNQITGNVGNMEQRGVEFNVNATIIDKKDLTWSVGLNTSLNRNKITNLSLIDNPNFPGLPTGGISGGIGQTIEINQIGYPKGSFYTLTPVYGANGKPLSSVFVDKNGDGVINSADLSLSQSPVAKELFGLSSDVTYKKINLGFVARASIGNYLYNNLASSTGIQRNFTGTPNFAYNGSSNVLESGLTGNGGNDVLSDYYLQNASFFRMDNIHIGYNFGKLNKHIGDLRVSGNVQNVFIITNYTGVDPEQFGGVDNNQYPRPRTFVIGLNLSL